ncbi:hypothetical protein VrSk94_33730 [Vibrio rotiferianus]
MKVKTSLSTIAVVSLVGCQSTGGGIQSLTLKEANSFISSAESGPDLIPQQLQRTWIQPINKKEACLLEASSQFKLEPNARAVWDGACKNGYADGFGRDIAISDYSHVEEITTYQNGSTINQYSVTRDYVNNSTLRVYKYAHSRISGSFEFINDSDTQFNVLYRTGEFNSKTFDYVYSESSPFNPVVSYINTVNGKVSYIFYDRTNQVGDVKSYTTIQNAQTGVFGGVSRFVMKNGYVQSEQLTANGSRPVNVPPKYWEKVDSYLSQVNSEISEGNNSYSQGISLENKYKYKVCNGDNVTIPKGLSREQYFAICNYDSKFSDKYQSTMKLVKEIYDADLEKYNNNQYKQQELAIKQREAEAAESRAAAAHRQANSVSSSNSGSAFSNTVQCYKMGQFLNKEIKTFSGMVCPIGWLQYYGW